VFFKRRGREGIRIEGNFARDYQFYFFISITICLVWSVLDIDLSLGFFFLVADGGIILVDICERWRIPVREYLDFYDTHVASSAIHYHLSTLPDEV